MENQQPNVLQKMINTGSQNQAQDNSAQKKNIPVLDSTIQRVFSDLTNITRRTRLVEERYMDLRKKVNLIEENSIAEDKEMRTQNKVMLDLLSEQRKVISEMKDKMNIMIKELQSCAKLNDLKILEKYISMWEPINYVTNDELDRSVGHIIDQKLSELNLKIQEENFIKKEIEKQINSQIDKIQEIFSKKNDKFSENNDSINLESNAKIIKEKTKSNISNENKDDKIFDDYKELNNFNNNVFNKNNENINDDKDNGNINDDKDNGKIINDKKEKDEIEEISQEINNMFKKKNSLNGIESYGDNEEDDVSIEDLIIK